MEKRLKKIEEKIDKIKAELMGIRTMRPGLVSRQYKDRKTETGSYYQISYTHLMKSRTDYVPLDFVAAARQQTAEYNRFKRLTDAWVKLSIEQSRLSIKLAKERSPPMAAKKKANELIEELSLYIRLMDIEPPIWRSLRMTTEMTLDQLHYAIQGAFSWQNSHLHVFEIKGMDRCSSNEINITEGDDKDSRDITLGSINKENISKFIYEYDFGDSWQHEVKIEEIKALAAPLKAPECTDGARQSPPEDCGGAPGFERFLKAMANKKHPEHNEMKEWFNGTFDEEKFTVKKANEDIKTFLKYAGMGKY